MRTVIADLSRCGRIFAVAATVAIAVAAPASAQDKAPDATANSDGSCVYHLHAGAGQIEDISIANGATYHQNERRGRKTGMVYVPDRLYLCKDGHMSRVKD